MAGEITARELPDIPAIVCRTVRGVGYTSDYEVEVITHDQSGDISKAVEQERLLRSDGSKVSLLGKYNFIEQDAKQLCRQAGLLSPVYEFTDRGGCWFCPNAKRQELRHLYDHHLDLWGRMLELQALPGKVTEKFNRTQRFSDIDAIFRHEDRKLERPKQAA